MYNVRIFLRSWDLSISTCYKVTGNSKVFFALFAVWCKIGRQMPLQIKGQCGPTIRQALNEKIDANINCHCKCTFSPTRSLGIAKQNPVGYGKHLYLVKSLKCTAQRTRSDICFTQVRYPTKDRPGQEGLSLSVSLCNFRDTPPTLFTKHSSIRGTLFLCSAALLKRKGAPLALGCWVLFLFLYAVQPTDLGEESVILVVLVVWGDFFISHLQFFGVCKAKTLS